MHPPPSVRITLQRLPASFLHFSDSIDQTPTPRRFLLPKRGTQASSQTPSAAAASTPRFQSTPRFGVSSSAARPISRKALSQEIEDVDEVGDNFEDEVLHDEEDRVISSSLGETGEDAERRRPERSYPGDEIVEESQSQDDHWSDEHGEDIVKESMSPEERRVKRRRLSVSPALTSSPVPSELPAPLSPEEEVATPMKADSPPWLCSDGEDNLSQDEGEDIDPTGRDVPAMHQPTFRPAPRFKTTEAEALADGLPAAFSPQRRGMKYVPGGLAAELQGWLSDVKRWDEEGGGRLASDTGSFRLLARDVRDGERMYLVDGEVQEGGPREVYILAGEGKLTGLGRRAEVGRGSMVEVDGPVWEVELEGRRWTVACEWSVIQ